MSTLSMRRKTEREFLQAVERDLSQLERLVEERSGEHARHPDLEALLRLARLEAGRRAKHEAERAAFDDGVTACPAAHDSEEDSR